MPNETVAVDPIKAGLEIAGEYVLPIPGGSNLVKGDIRQAAIHAGLGIVARAFFGPLGMFLVSANSLSQALTDRSLTENLGVGTAVTPEPAVKTK